MSISTWKRCSSCKTDIEFGQTYWVCNVSTCNRKRTGLYFCSVPCWEAHLPTMRHRESWAVEKRAPSAAEWEREQQSERDSAPPPPTSTTRSSSSSSSSSAPRRRVVGNSDDDDRADVPREILIVASKLKKYIKARSGFNTSDAVMARLSDHVRWVADQAIRSAGEDERRTVLDRDVPPVPRR